MNQKEKTFQMKDYGRKPTFASFLPGISGLRGIPIWCYYVNRGQGVVSFGAQDKDGAIMEFYPAHQAYQNVKRTGFRTFIRREGQIYEPFAGEHENQCMEIFRNALELTDENAREGLRTEVCYYTLPEETLGGLARRVSIQNLSGQPVMLEVLDGMPACIPCGVDMESMKNMGQTAKAWMQAEDVESGVPFYRTRASMADSSVVTRIQSGNFALGLLADGSRLRPLVDPQLVFGYDTSLEKAVGFAQDGLDGLYRQKQSVSNRLPCAFFGWKAQLQPGESTVVYELIGQVRDKKRLMQFLEQEKDAAYFEAKRRRADELTEELCRPIACKTANADFDAYSSYTFMDNVLRGGYPIMPAPGKPFYVYSRKHGDLERDYNFFSMLPEYYSQGNGNFRDVNQNRRCDCFFAPLIGDANIRMFYSMIQLDGYNPLGIEKITYRLEEQEAQAFGAQLGTAGEGLKELLTKPFTPGALCMYLEETGESSERQEELFGSILGQAKDEINGRFIEGYWSDHWTYNLDLLESYLSIWPEKEEELLFTPHYTYFRAQAQVRARRERYEITQEGVRQYHALLETPSEEKLERDKNGGVVRVTLFEKLLLLAAVKFATLDGYGMGIEMEGGKPGWYDALNGLPGLLGSSVTESCELARHLVYTLSAIRRYCRTVSVAAELAELMQELSAVVKRERGALFAQDEVSGFWNGINDAKEAYRRKIYGGVSGSRVELEAWYLEETLEEWERIVRHGIQKACARTEGGICPAYFTYRVTEYRQEEQGILPLHFAAEDVPLFLEGPVRWLKLPMQAEQKRTLYGKVRASGLYDKKLSMYKVNASLENASFELGRARAFTPGWLENESIWLHMEYKYLLELLKSGMYGEFAEDFHKAVVAFMEPQVYGRSIYENSSFLASSANPDEALHGRGFVARLSGSSVEFLQMWQMMMFGQKPFVLKDGSLCFAPRPFFPTYLVEEHTDVETVLMGRVKVIYHIGEKKDYIPQEYEVGGIIALYEDGRRVETLKGEMVGKTAEDIRDGAVRELEITLV